MFNIRIRIGNPRRRRRRARVKNLHCSYKVELRITIYYVLYSIDIEVIATYILR